MYITLYRYTNQYVYIYVTCMFYTRLVNFGDMNSNMELLGK